MDTAQPAPLASAAPRRRRRAIPVVDGRFQWKYTLAITALGAGITAVMGAFLYRTRLASTRLLDLEGNVALEREIVRSDQVFLLYLVVLVVVMAVALALWGLVVTHRVSGPLHVIARYFGELADGRYPDLRPLRKHDELQEFFAGFEEAVERLKARDGAALRGIDEALSAGRRALATDPRGGLEGAVAALERLRAHLAERLRPRD